MISGKSMISLQGGLKPEEKGMPNRQWKPAWCWKASLVLETQLMLRITCATYKTNAGSRSTEPGPWGWGLKIIILKSCTGQAGHQLGLGATITALGQQLSSDVEESVCLYLTTDPPLRTWASYSTSLCLSFLLYKMMTKIRPTLGVAVVLNEFIYLEYLQ